MLLILLLSTSPGPQLCYNGVHGLIPIPQNLLKNANNDQIATVMLNMSRNPELVSIVPPNAINTNCMFIVNLDELKDPEDILCDDLGAWRQTETSKKLYAVEKDLNGEVIAVVPRNRQPTTKEEIEIIRRPFVNVSDHSLRKVVVSIIYGEKLHNFVFVKYQFSGPCHKVIVKPHGNSKQTTSYVRTFKSTKTSIQKELANTTSVRRAIFNVTKSVGGVESSQCSGVLPRDGNQGSYIRGKQNELTNDPIFNVTTTMRNYEENGNERFIRSYSLDDGSPKIIAYTDSQIDSLVDFCCNDTNGFKSLLYVDLTFQLGPFYMLLTVHTNTMLLNKRTNTCPVIIGPLMLCMLKDEQTYTTLFQKINSSVPGLRSFLQGYATDSEQALRNVLAQEYPHTSAFICGIHGKKNISEYCSKLGLSSILTQTIKRDIFGDGGLVHVKTRAEFDERCTNLKARWNELEAAEKVNPRFVSYFTKHKQEDIFDHMRIKLSIDGGFGDQLITTNPIESVNAVVKRWNNFQSTDCANFLNDIKQCIDEQQSNIQKAFLNLPSPYTVRPEFVQHIVTDYHHCNLSEREKICQRLAKIRVNKDRFREVKVFRVPIATSELALSDSETGSSTPNDSADPLSSLLVMFTRSDIDTLKTKAATMVSNGEIMKGFSDQHYIVKSTSCKYRTVTVNKNHKIACEKGCLGYEGRKICAHTIATALYTSQLTQYIGQFIKHNSVNLTRMTVASVNPNAGKKVEARKRKRAMSPDVISSSAAVYTLGDVFETAIEPQQLAVTHLSNSGMKMKIATATKKPTRPLYRPTISTPFELIEISGNISKCAGCGGNLKEGPDPILLTELDKNICIRHKERDHIFLTKQNFWKPTFANRHYHVFKDCVTARNPAFNATAVIFST